MSIRFVPALCACCGRIFDVEERELKAAPPVEADAPHLFCALCTSPRLPRREVAAFWHAALRGEARPSGRLLG